MVPFIDRKHGPRWFTRKFPTSSPENPSKALYIWVAFFKHTILSTRIMIGKAGLGIAGYQPNLVARHFGFSLFVSMKRKYVWLIRH